MKIPNDIDERLMILSPILPLSSLKVLIPVAILSIIAIFIKVALFHARFSPNTILIFIVPVGLAAFMMTEVEKTVPTYKHYLLMIKYHFEGEIHVDVQTNKNSAEGIRHKSSK